MNNYLSLVFQYARVHKRKSRLTVICITVSVMLVTTIFGMADMSLRSQTDEAIRRYGNWHAIISDLPDNLAVKIGKRQDINVAGYLGMAADTTYKGKELIVQSSSEELARQMNLIVTNGHYPASAREALLDRPAMEQFNLSIGDWIEVAFSDGQVRKYQISGMYRDYSTLKGSDAHGLQLSPEGMRELPAGQYKEFFYIQFKNKVNINEALSQLKAEYQLSDKQVSTNVMLLGLMGQSDNSTMMSVYLTAGILFVLVLLAGVFMIASSFNMSILERTQFFGLLRCLGATKKQIRRYVRLEGLQYCLRAIPAGVLAGSIILWIAIAVLNGLNSQYLPVMPMFKISLPGILAGAGTGIIVVMIASDAPAKHAAKVSPQEAVTGNINQFNNYSITKASNTKLFPVDIAMGLNHAFSNTKSMILISGSFAISIILFLCFTILVTFMNHALSPLKPYAPDMTLEGDQNTALLNHSLKESLKSLPYVKNVYGRMFYTNIQASDKNGANTATLVSYDEPQFQWAKEALISGDIDQVQNGNGVLVDYGYLERFGWKIGDVVTLNIGAIPYKVKVDGIVSGVPFDSVNGEWIIVCSESTFTALTGISDYKVIDMQVSQDISDQVRQKLPAQIKLLDLQQHNNEVRTGYFAMAVFVYGFLLVIAFVALINIINTVNASVSGRMNHYGVMRAVGMSGGQLKRVVMAEAAAYAITGSITGGILGLFLHRIFFNMLITANWGQNWQPPLLVLSIIISAAILTTFAAAISPTKKIEEMVIVNVVNAW